TTIRANRRRSTGSTAMPVTSSSAIRRDQNMVRTTTSSRTSRPRSVARTATAASATASPASAANSAAVLFGEARPSSMIRASAPDPPPVHPTSAPDRNRTRSASGAGPVGGSGEEPVVLLVGAYRHPRTLAGERPYDDTRRETSLGERRRPIPQHEP